MSHFGEEPSIRTMKKFIRKFGGEFEKDDYKYSYYNIKNGIFYRLQVEYLDNKNGQYEGIVLEQSNESQLITFLGETQKNAILKKISGNKDFEYWGKNKSRDLYVYNPLNSLISLNFNDNGTIYYFSLSKEALHNAKVLKKSQEAFSKFNKDYTIKEISIDQSNIHQYDHTKPNIYQIGHLFYEGHLVNGLPHGKANWGLFSKDEFPDVYFDCDVAFFVGEFKNGKPVGIHEGKEGKKRYIYTFKEGILLEQKTNELIPKIVYKLKDKNTFTIGDLTEVKYTGPLDEEGRPNSEKARFILGPGKTVITKVEGGKVKKGSKATFIIQKNNTNITTEVDEALRIHGKAIIFCNNYNATLYYKNGILDFSKPVEIELYDLKLSELLKGRSTITGMINKFNLDNGYFEGNNLVYKNAKFPNTQIIGNYSTLNNMMIPTGWHTLTEMVNGLEKIHKGKYSPMGNFIIGYNIYEKDYNLIYDEGVFTDHRNNKSYRYKSFLKSDHTIITWMLDNIYNENYTEDVWRYRDEYGTQNKNCYYTRNKSYSVCPNGWRLPTKIDIQEIQSIDQSKEKRYITNNETLIRVLNLNRDGYIYRTKYIEDFRGTNNDVNIWLDKGYTSITKLNRGLSSTTLDEKLRLHVCRCVKDQALR